MIFDEASLLELKDYLCRQLEPIAEADPMVLSDYTIALLKSDKSTDEIKSLCLQKLDEFLKGQTKPFVEFLFQFLKKMDGRKNDSQLQEMGGEQGKGDDDDDEEEEEEEETYRSHRYSFESRSSKRRQHISVESEDDEDADRNPKHRRAKRLQTERECSNYGQPIPTSSFSYDRRDRTWPLVRRTYRDGRVGDDPHDRRRHYKDFMDRGKGVWRDTYESDFFAFGKFGPYQEGRTGRANRGRAMYGHRPSHYGAYASTMMMPLPMSMSVEGSPMYRCAKGRRGDDHDGTSRLYDCSPSTNMDVMGTPYRPNPASTRLVIEKIPLESCNEAAVKGHFGQFGTILEHSFFPEQRKATITFAHPEEALAAYQSPEVIFDNRFVKVYWDRTDTRHFESSKGSSAGLESLKSSNPTMMDPLPPSVLKRQRTLYTVLGLRKQQEVLLQKQIEQQKFLISKLAVTDGVLSEQDRVDLMAKLKAIQAIVTEIKASLTAVKVSSHATVGATMEESETGTKIQPCSTDVNTLTFSTKGTSNALCAPNTAPARTIGKYSYSASMRGAFRGGRGSSTWIRGVTPNSAASQSTTGTALLMRSMKLDLRSRSIVLAPIPTYLKSDKSALQVELEEFGKIENIEYDTDAACATITFQMRHEAELAMKNGTRLDLQEPFTLSWKQSVPPVSVTSTASTRHTTSDNQPGEHVNVAVVDAMQVQDAALAVSDSRPSTHESWEEMEANEMAVERSWKR